MALSLIEHATADKFLAATQSYLERDEAVNNLMLGVALRLRVSPVPCRLLTIDDGKTLSLAALQTPPFPLTLYSPLDDFAQAVDLLAGYLRDVKAPVTATSGRTELATHFAQCWANLIGVSYETRMRMGAYELRRVIPAPPTEGQFRIARASDIPFLTEWIRSFLIEALHGQDPSTAGDITVQRVGNGDLFLWEVEGKPVSMAGRARPMIHGITVNMVYTPPEFRGRGYATACVAALSQHLLNEGWQFCTLFTDLANPTSNSIYKKIGYVPLCEYAELAFN